MRIKTSALIAFAGIVLAGAMPASAGAVLDRIKETGHIRLGYVPDAKPFTSMGASSPEGYGVQVCEAVVGQLKIQLGLPDLKTDWVAVSIESRFADIKNAGGRLAGSITAAHFLQHFVNDVPWARLEEALRALRS